MHTTETFYSQSHAFKEEVFIFLYTKFLLTSIPDDAKAMKSYWETALATDNFDRIYLLHLLMSLTQAKLYYEVARLTKIYQTNFGSERILRFKALIETGDVAEALGIAREFLRKIALIDIPAAHGIFIMFDTLAKKGVDTVELYSAEIKDRQYESVFIQDLVFCYIHRYQVSFEEEVRAKSKDLISNFQSCDETFRTILLIILSAIKEDEVIISLFDQYIDWRSEPILVLIYTESVLAIKKDSDRLLGVLKERRNVLPEQRLLTKELTIYAKARNYQECLELCRLGMLRYPQNPNIKYYHLVTLYKTKDPSIDIELTDQLHDFQFSWFQKFSIARICILRGKGTLGIELFYREVKSQPNNPSIRHHYLLLTTIRKGRETVTSPENIQLGTVVEIAHNGKAEILEIDSTALESNWIVPGIIGKKPGDSVTLTTPASGRKMTISIVRVLDKYSGLTVQIFKEVQDSNLTGMPVEAFDLNTDNIEKFKENLIELFGEKGEKETIRRQSLLEKYYSQEISFTDVVTSITGDQPMDMYDYLTSNSSNGFSIVPLVQYKGFKIPDDAEIVVDVTTIPILKAVSEKLHGVFKKKFLISQFLIEYLESELEKAQEMPDEQARLIVTLNHVQTRFAPPEYRQARIDQFKAMIDWCSAYCEPKIAKLKMDMILERPDLAEHDHVYENYLIDTSCLAFGRVLLSDDLIHVLRFKNNYPTLSIEFYLSQQFPDCFKEDLLPILINKHYIGIRLYKENIINEFKRPFYGGVNTFHYCLENLEYKYHGDDNILFECIDMIKEIYLTENLIDFKKQTAQQIFVSALSSYPGSQNLGRQLRMSISEKFHLLQPYLISVMNDLAAALQIVGEGRKL